MNLHLYALVVQATPSSCQTALQHHPDSIANSAVLASWPDSCRFVSHSCCLCCALSLAYLATVRLLPGLPTLLPEPAVPRLLLRCSLLPVLTMQHAFQHVNIPENACALLGTVGPLPLCLPASSNSPWQAVHYVLLLC